MAERTQNIVLASPSEHAELLVQLPKDCVAKPEPSAFPGGGNPIINPNNVGEGLTGREFLRQREESAEVAVPSTNPRQRVRESILESQAH